VSCPPLTHSGTRHASCLDREDAMSRTKAAVVFQQSPSSKSLLDVKEIPANGSSNYVPPLLCYKGVRLVSEPTES
jgi:hypothetical protein